jgi:hypothetical protein
MQGGAKASADRAVPERVAEAERVLKFELQRRTSPPPAVVTRTVCIEAVANVIVVAHGRANPTEADWGRLLEWYRAPGMLDLSVFVHTTGGAPNPTQRRALTRAFGRQEPRIAVVTPSLAARVAGVALSWFNSGVRIFGPHEMDRALAHVGAAGSDAELVRAWAERIQRHFGLVAA